MEKKDIVIRITGTQTGGDGNKEDMDFITEGALYSRNGFFYAVYDETLISGDPSCKTTLKYSRDILKMKREGADMGEHTVIEFTPNGEYHGAYQTPFGPLEMNVKTLSYENDLDEEGMGSVSIEYDIALRSIVHVSNKITVQIARKSADFKQPKLS